MSWSARARTLSTNGSTALPCFASQRLTRSSFASRSAPSAIGRPTAKVLVTMSWLWSTAKSESVRMLRRCSGRCGSRPRCRSPRRVDFRHAAGLRAVGASTGSPLRRPCTSSKTIGGLHLAAMHERTRAEPHRGSEAAAGRVFASSLHCELAIDDSHSAFVCFCAKKRPAFPPPKWNWRRRTDVG